MQVLLGVARHARVSLAPGSCLNSRPGKSPATLPAVTQTLQYLGQSSRRRRRHPCRRATVRTMLAGLVAPWPVAVHKTFGTLRSAASVELSHSASHRRSRTAERGHDRNRTAMLTWPRQPRHRAVSRPVLCAWRDSPCCSFARKCCNHRPPRVRSLSVSRQPPKADGLRHARVLGSSSSAQDRIGSLA
jgi:hypothetical protein